MVDADLVFVAVLGTAAVDLATGVREQLTGKVLVDTTNPMDFSSGPPGLFVGHTDSLGERGAAGGSRRGWSRPTTPSGTR